MAIPSKKNGDGFWRNDQPPAVADPTLDAFIARLAESDLSSHTTTVGWICGGPDLAVWCRACCVRALTRHVATLRDDAAYHADCRPNRRAAEAAQARVLELEVQVAALTATERATADAFIAYRYHPHCTSATGWCPVCARVQQSTFRAPTPQFRDYEGDVIAGPDPFRDARVDASVAYAAGAAAGREFGRGEGAPPSLVALHAAWRASSDAIAVLNEEDGGEDVEAFGVACDRYDSDREALLAWTPEETP